MAIRRYSEMIALPTFEERFEYLKLHGVVGKETFGYDRYLNQIFYRSKEWKSIREYVSIRDNACDLAMDGRDIYGTLIIHHMNPLTLHDIESNSPLMLDPEFLVCTTINTHNAIHYGDYSLIPSSPVDRTPNDTCPWK